MVCHFRQTNTRDQTPWCLYQHSYVIHLESIFPCQPHALLGSHFITHIFLISKGPPEPPHTEQVVDELIIMFCFSPPTPYSHFVESVEFSLMLNILFLDITFSVNKSWWLLLLCTSPGLALPVCLPLLLFLILCHLFPLLGHSQSVGLLIFGFQFCWSLQSPDSHPTLITQFVKLIQNI